MTTDEPMASTPSTPYMSPQPSTGGDPLMMLRVMGVLVAVLLVVLAYFVWRDSPEAELRGFMQALRTEILELNVKEPRWDMEGTQAAGESNRQELEDWLGNRTDGKTLAETQFGLDVDGIHFFDPANVELVLGSIPSAGSDIMASEMRTGLQFYLRLQGPTEYLTEQEYRLWHDGTWEVIPLPDPVDVDADTLPSWSTGPQGAEEWKEARDMLIALAAGLHEHFERYGSYMAIGDRGQAPAERMDARRLAEVLGIGLPELGPFDITDFRLTTLTTDTFVLTARDVDPNDHPDTPAGRLSRDQDGRWIAGE